MKKNLLSNVCLAFFLALSFTAANAAEKAQPQAQEKKKEKDDIGSLRREGIDVVQNRVFIKGGRTEFTLGTGFIFDNPYLRYETLEGRITYHFREMLAFEGSYAYAFHQDKSIIKDLNNIPCDPNNPLYTSPTDPNSILTNCGVSLNPGPDPYQHILNGNLVWAPIYGKFSIFSKKILHFDIFATAGAGYYMAERDNRFGFNVGVGTKVFINDWTAVRIDFRNFTIKEGAPFNHIVNNRILSIGMSFFLPTKIDREQ